MTALALLLAGYSLFSATAIAFGHFGSGQYSDQPRARIMGLVLLLALSGLQAAHFGWLYLDRAWLGSLPYRVLLFAVAPAFFLFSRPLLQPPATGASRIPDAAHFLPPLAAALLPVQVAQPAAFVLGAVYLVALGRLLLALRHERERFPAEIVLLGSAFALAVGTAVLALAPSLLPGRTFVALYTCAIGLAFLLVQTTLNLRPQLTTEVREVAQAAYANSTLGKVDCEGVLARLDDLMTTGRLFIDPELSLASLAAHLGLSSHQLSELLNSRMGKGFARYVRERRIAAARTMLRDEPSASVLSVGLSVGFTSQSTFYEAFREIEGTTPARYRKLQRHPGGTG